MASAPSDPDIYRLATTWMQRYGDMAALRARQRAAERAAAGDSAGASVWLRIVVAILDLQKAKQGPLS